jgi:hypothetical protein
MSKSVPKLTEKALVKPDQTAFKSTEGEKKDPSWYNPLNLIRSSSQEPVREPTPPPEPSTYLEQATALVKGTQVYSTVSDKAEALKSAVLERTNTLKTGLSQTVDALPQTLSETAVASAASTAVRIKQSPLPGLVSLTSQKLEELSNGAAAAAGGQGLVEVAAAESARLAIKFGARAMQAGRYVVRTSAKAGLEAYVAWQTSPSYEQLKELKVKEREAQKKYGKIGLVRDEAGWQSDGSSPKKSASPPRPSQKTPQKKGSSDWSSETETDEEDQGLTSRARSTLSSLWNYGSRSRSSSAQPKSSQSPRRRMHDDDLSFRPLTKDDTIRISVGGQTFVTKAGTIFAANKGSKLNKWFREGNRDLQVLDGAFFIDRDGTQFRHILNWLRDNGSLKSIRDERDLREVRQEAEWYELWGTSQILYLIFF